MSNVELTKEDLLDLHCAHGKRVYERCRQCEHDVRMNRGRGFTPPGERGCAICGKKECRGYKP